MPNEEKFAEVTRKSKAKRAQMNASAETKKAADLQNEETARYEREVAEQHREVAASEDMTAPDQDPS